ncbi:MAG: hypothetical protein Kow0074_18560 [Candidatus Zixiibacteriota bacterium]
MIGQKIAHYQIVEKLGQGGMGEVFLAEDGKLDRKVALKFLPDHVSLEGDVKARFLQEAKAASAFTHPNVCTVHDIVESDGRMFIVMEHVDGQTLRDKRDALSLTQIIEIGAQVADGLAAAHQQGIVHRDIKSENIMLRRDGIAQITDFGLAKLRGVASRLTKEGSTLGTTGYMSPEQALGQDVDHRSDIFSLGVVLYELLTGQMPFTGAHEAAIMYEIVNVEAAPPSAINPDLDPEIDRILLECLQKEPDERYQSAREVAKDLRRFKRDSGRKRVSRISQSRLSVSRAPSRVSRTDRQETAGESGGRRSLGWLPWAVSAVLGLALLYVAFGRGPANNATGAYRFSLHPPDGLGLAIEGGGNLAVSPNGRYIVFAAVDSLQTPTLWLRPIDRLSAQQLPGTELAWYPFWSPDSRYVGFFTQNGKLKKIDVTGGPPVVLCDAQSGRGGSWNQNGDIIFSPASFSGLWRVSAAGGVPTQITYPDSTGERNTHRWPTFLPDGDHFLYYVRTGTGGMDTSDDSVHVAALDGSMDRALFQSEGNAIFASEHLLFTRDRTLMAQPFDPNGLEYLGDPFPIAEDVYFDAGFNNAVFTASANGTVSYLTGAGTVVNQLLWYDRSGAIIDSLGGVGVYGNCRLSPDGSHFAVEMQERNSGNNDIWVFDLERNVKTRLTFDPRNDMSPVWSPNGKFIYYASFQTGNFDIYRKNASGAGDATLIYHSTKSKWPISMSRDGRTLIVHGIGDVGIGDDIWSLPIDPVTGDAVGELTPFQQTEFDEDDAHLSPDGRWLAFSSNETGRYEVYVRPFPGPGGKWQISNTGGDFSYWSDDGRELFYIAADGAVMVVEVDGRGSSFRAGEPRRLFGTKTFSTNSPWSVTSDGQKFIVVSLGVGEAENRIDVVVNWTSEVESR